MFIGSDLKVAVRVITYKKVMVSAVGFWSKGMFRGRKERGREGGRAERKKNSKSSL